MGKRDELTDTQPAGSTLEPTAGQAVRDFVRKIQAPRMLGRYRLDGELGRGGMGAVHAAFDLDLERKVAIKVLHGDPHQAARLRLMREARAMARIDHPNVVKIFEVDTHDGTDFVVMELVDGGAITDWLATKPSRAQIIAAFADAGRGLSAAHAKGMIHRDFKPHNVLRSHDGRIKVGDFGLAREADAGGSAPDVTIAAGELSPLGNLTQTGAFVGTPAYMAPEQWAAGTISNATDQFAFCVALWEALTGERPFRGDSTDQLREAIARGPAALDIAKVPHPYRAVLVRGLAADPANRFGSIDELVAALTKRRVRPLAVVGYFVLALAMGLTIYNVLHRPTPTSDPQLHLPKTRAQLVASVSEIDPTHFAIDRDVFEQLLRDRSELTETVHLSPTADHVWRLYAVRPSGLAAKLHLQDFDEISSVAGITLATDQDLAKLFEALHTATTFDIVGTRKGAPLTRTITIR
ncbi:MAG: serine/threonine-protein kinase [Kofleriaceae bacterium]